MIEELIQQNTKALIENTAALREILSVGAATAADTLVPTTPKKRAAKAAPLTVVTGGDVDAIKLEEGDSRTLVTEPEPEAPFQVTPQQDGTVTVAPGAAQPEPVEETPEVPDLPVAELRNSLKEVIKGKLLADTEGTVKATFDALRAKYGVSVIKELADDQVGAFYQDVLSWG